MAPPLRPFSRKCRRGGSRRRAQRLMMSLKWSSSKSAKMKASSTERLQDAEGRDRLCLKGRVKSSHE